MKYILLALTALLYANITFAQSDTIQIIPPNPTINDSVIVVIYTCEFDINSFSVKDDTITIITSTNSLICGPCVLIYDTIKIGKFSSGTKYIKYLLVDDEIFTEDSILYSRTLEFNVSDISGISTNPEYNQWKIYPNPARNVILVESNNPDFNIENIGLIISDLQGKILQEELILNRIETIDISNLQKGIHILQLKGSDIYNSFYLIKK